MKIPLPLWHNRAILTGTEISLDGNIAELERLASEIARFCADHELAGDMEFDLNLVLEELFTNTVRHGGCEGMPGAARIRLERQNGAVRVEYSDRGTPFNPLADAPPPNLAPTLMERKTGGLGVYLVRQLMQDLEYQRQGDSNRLSMTRRIDIP